MHILVVPKKTPAWPEAVQEEDESVIGKMVRTAKEIANTEGLTDYRPVFNNGAGAGQTVFHLHMHILGGRSLAWPPG